MRPGRGAWALLLLLLPIVGGCGYRLGYERLPRVRRVAVPVFSNDTFRLRIEEELTRRVAEEIGRRTPYRLARPSEADAVLLGEIVDVDRAVLVEGPADEPREFGLTVRVRVRLVTPDGRVLRGPSEMEERAEAVVARDEDDDTAVAEAFDDLAARIAWLLEDW